MRSFSIACLLGAVAMAAPDDEKVAGMPDATPFASDTYSGYLVATETKRLHYMFTESLDDPKNDPLVIWFNGGPGCSSMLGFIQENGPRVIEDGATSVTDNPYPWNMRANVMWLESPAGVGFSTASDTDMHTNDLIQSEDAFKALRDWYAKFPEFKENDLFISGESYAGIYVPFLALQIYWHNLRSENDPSAQHINLKGTMVGNGATDWDFDSTPTFPDTVYNFNLVPKDLRDKWYDNNCHEYFRHVFPSRGPPACKIAMLQMQNYTSNLNWYDLYRPQIPPTSVNNAARYGMSIVGNEKKYYKRGWTWSEYTPWAHHVNTENQVVMGDFVSDYLNRADVREALHIPTEVPAWEMCSTTIDYKLQDEASLWIYEVLNGKVRMMFYSGDTDGAIPTYGTKLWIQKLNRATTNKWRSWLTDEQVSGYIENYQGLDFITVKGVGHMAPQWARKPVTSMVTKWMHGEDI